MTIKIERDGPLTTVTICRARQRNAINEPMAQALRKAFADFEADAEARVAVLYGEGGHFCAGYDLKAAATGEILDIYEPTGDGPMGPTRRLLSKPVIAAVEGYAVAGGLELALWCDLRVASETAIFGVFCRRWGAPLVDGGTVRLPRLIGQSRALDMILTGRAVAADEAHDIGLANRLVPAGRALAEAQALAHQIARFPPVCLAADRASVHAQWNLPIADALKAEGSGAVESLRTESVAGSARFAAGKGRGGAFDDI